jgi:DNA-nicking Smr family endonuclease
MVTDDGRTRRRRLSDDERTLWHRVTRSIAPLKRARIKVEPVDRETVAPGAPTPPKAKPPPPARVTKSRPAEVAKPAPTPAPMPASLDRKQKKRLARGTEPIDARIDLHGLTQSEAHSALLHFLRRAQHREAKFVLVITGKGRFKPGDVSREVGVLKRQVPQWLRLPEFRAYVTGFEDAHIAHGGEGALYVRLRRARAE